LVIGAAGDIVERSIDDAPHSRSPTLRLRRRVLGP
jgi:hypothetical protein